MPAPLSNAGCVKNCDDTDAMAATQDDNGDDTTCVGVQTFVANDQGSPTTLCSEQVCSLWLTRGTTACKVLMDVPTTCADKASESCPIILLLSRSGRANPKCGSTRSAPTSTTGLMTLSAYIPKVLTISETLGVRLDQSRRLMMLPSLYPS